jgi:uncharacterized protein YbaP (TraB family)
MAPSAWPLAPARAHEATPGGRRCLAALAWMGLLVLAALPAHARAGALTAAAPAASAEYLPYGSAPDNPRPVAAHHQGGLFRASHGGRVAYLFGTVHVGMRGFYPLPPEVGRALGGANRVVVELDTRANDAFLHALALHGRYAPGDDVRRHLSAPTVRALTEAMHGLGISVASMAAYKPWLVANLLLSAELERKGYRRSDGVEQALLEQARQHGLRVAQLESADYQLALYDSMDEAHSERYLKEVLDGLADGRALRTAQAVIEAWSSGDVHALDVALQESTAGPGAVEEFTRRVLLGRRNPEMADHIERLMREDSVTFVGVGLLHLLGANGLPQLLAQRGYLVERVY